MKQELKDARDTLWAYLLTGNRANRRKVVQAFKLVDKAARVMGLERIERTPKQGNAVEVKFPKTDEVRELPLPDSGTVLADNSTKEQAGPERVKRGRKPKGE